MTATYVAFGTVASDAGTTLAPGTINFSGTGIPSGTGTGFLAVIFWGNAEDEPPTYDEAVWTFLGDSKGGAGTWGTDDTGPRHVSLYWTTTDLTGTTQTFVNGGSNSVANMILGYIVRCAKTLTYWDLPQVAEASDNVGGAGFAATFNRNPGAAAGDLTILATIANTDAVNPSGLIMDWPGMTLGTNTAITTTPSTAGNDSRVNLRYRTVTSGTPTGPPTVASTTDFTGAAIMVRLRDTATAPVTMSAGPDQTDVEPGATVTIDSSLSINVASGRTWSQTLGTTVTLSSTTAIAPTFTAPYTLNGETLRFRVTDNATGNFDEVDVTVDFSSARIKTASGWSPIQIRVVE